MLLLESDDKDVYWVTRPLCLIVTAHVKVSWGYVI